MGEIIERPVRGAAFHAEGEWAIPEGYEAEIKDGKIIVRKKESEDEVHRKWILEYLYDGLRKADEQFKDHFKAAIVWLEKQKPAELGEEDEKMLDGCVNNLIELKNRFGEGYGRVGDCIAWLKSRRPNSNKRPTEEE